MKRISRAWLLAMFVVMAVGAREAGAQNAWLSLNLEFNGHNDFNSGGKWTVAAKSDSAGLAGVNVYLADATTFTGFLSPPEFDVRVQTLFGEVRNIVVGHSLSGPYPLGIGLIGSSFPSTYVDPPGLATLDGYPDVGSFTGGLAVATGTFAAGVIPVWTSQGPLMSVSGANVFTGPAPAPVAMADTVVTVATVRYYFTVIPEPATSGLMGLAAIGLGAAARRGPTCRRRWRCP